MMTELKTRPSDRSVEAYLDGVEPEARRLDALALLEIFSRVTGREPVMWGDSIIGFGSYTYTNTRGEASWLMTGFSPRKRNLTVYVMQGFERFADQVRSLGKVKHAKSCLYIDRLSDIDVEVLERFLREVVADMEARFRCT